MWVAVDHTPCTHTSGYLYGFYNKKISCVNKYELLSDYTNKLTIQLGQTPSYIAYLWNRPRALSPTATILALISPD